MMNIPNERVYFGYHSSYSPTYIFYVYVYVSQLQLSRLRNHSLLTFISVITFDLRISFNSIKLVSLFSTLISIFYVFTLRQ